MIALIWFLIFSNMEGTTILIDWYDLLDGGFAAATVLVSFGVVIGKTTPMQLLGLAFIEVPLWVLVNYIGYDIIGAIDVGKILLFDTASEAIEVNRGLFFQNRRRHFHSYFRCLLWFDREFSGPKTGLQPSVRG